MRTTLAIIALCLCSFTPADEQASWTGGLPLLERPARPEELIAYPADRTPSGVNPPGFCWTPHDDARSYRLEAASARRPSSLVLQARGLASTVYPPAHPLPSGEYVWQVVYVDAEGRDYGVSRTRAFSLPPGLPELPMPDVRELRRRLEGVRPRLYLGGGRLERIREAARRGEIREWNYFISAADAALREPPYAEPKGYAGGKFNVEDWRRIYQPGKVGSAHLARLALAYRVTGERKYLEGARRRMMNLASWDPTGIISHSLAQEDGSEGNDEASMPVLERMAFAWDWIGGELTPRERARVLAVMPERGNQVLRLLKQQDFLSHPFSNHEGRSLAFLGNAGLSFLGDLPEAEEWLDYVLRCYLTSFPGWGGDEGGWAQGIGYWAAYVHWLSTFAESLRGASGVDILHRPFYRNNGHFPVHFHPPYAPMGAFGDGGDGKPSRHEKMLIDYFAETFADPLMKWHAASIDPGEVTRLTDAGEERPWNEWFIEDLVAVWRAGTARLRPEPPKPASTSRFQRDIGWVAAHTALGDARNDVWVLFKSSRFGSFSHSHADQNSFQLNAYGEALAIDSGYYPYYGSPHHTLWTRQTRAHNAILVNGRGQPGYSWAAGGDVEHFQQQGPITIARGQAAGAYNLPHEKDTIELWKEVLRESLPPIEPKVKSFERTAVFVASSSRPVLFVYDSISAEGPATYDWLLHALEEMAVEPDAGRITIRRGRARLAVRLLAAGPVDFNQTRGFPVKPEERAAGWPDQWHLAARTRSAAAEMKFLAALVPYREDEPPPQIVATIDGSAAGLRVGKARIAVWWKSGVKGDIELEGLRGTGRLLIEAAGTRATGQ